MRTMTIEEEKNLLKAKEDSANRNPFGHYKPRPKSDTELMNIIAKKKRKKYINRGNRKMGMK